MLLHQHKGLQALVGFVVLLLISWPLGRLIPSPPLKSLFPYSQAVIAADGSLLRLTTTTDEQYRFWLPLEDINSNMIDAMLMQEDQWFYFHPGVNPFSLIRGAFATYTGGMRQGGSTISMQLARLIERKSTRTPLAKLKQIFQTLWIEWRYSKKEILEAYLNLAPYGGNIQGVGAASWLYFNKPAAQLTTLEAAILAVIPQQPNLRPRNPESTHAALTRLLARWQQQQPNRNELNVLPLPEAYLPKPPLIAAHATDRLLATNKTSSVIKSTIEPSLQQLLERHLQLAKPQLNRLGIENAAALLVHWPTNSVVSMVGSLDYFDIATAGQVNGTLAKRSPGSTLKPLLFALALEQGLIHPLTILKDSPQNFGAYSPENFDGAFAGPISATKALNRSRNIPAVSLATKLSTKNDLYSLLKKSEVKPLASRQHYGLALVLGAGETSMHELARMYSMMANHGIDTPLTLTQDNDSRKQQRLLSAAASYLALDMLSQNTPPHLNKRSQQHPWFTAWKTGTSWSFRDAWTAGVVGSYVLIIWTGNFDGSANPGLIGIKSAAPLWWRIAEALPNAVPTPEQKRQPPSELVKVEICEASGELPNDICPERVQSWFIPGVSPINVSRLHKKVWVKKHSEQAACPPFTEQHEQRIYEFWPSDLAQLFVRAGLPRRTPPHIECSASLVIQEQGSPEIISPYSNMTFMMNASGPGVVSQLPLQASASANVTTLYWLIENRLLGQTAPGEIFYWQPKKPGRYLLNVSDDHGRSDSRWVNVGALP